MTINPVITPVDDLVVVVTVNGEVYNVLVSPSQPIDFTFNLTSAVVYDGDVVTNDGEIVFYF